ncbi:MAG: biotin attachment protein [Lentisphaerae bacterium RIFOXYC12_FULL_60_16]|nr:MAG: biotin attachment protein [Lentisphaerae bacterium RIFOXYC12_FULL_60_16]
MKKIDTMITAFRDGFQSVYGARVYTNDYLPAIEATRAAGLTHFEAGGGARFQAPVFYCNENPFEAMDAFRRAAGPAANLQTLARGVNVVALDSQSSDIVRLHAVLFKRHGMTTIRNFDALNDVDNLVDSGQFIHDAGLRHEICISMMALPPGCTGAHDADFYERTMRVILDAGIPYDSVCFKDASGTSTPATIFDTIQRARRRFPAGTRIVFHTHDTAGTGIACYLAALHGGADQVDLSMAPVSGGTCQPDVISLWHALRGSEFDLDLNIDKIIEAESVLKECMKDYFMPPEAKAVEPLIPFSPMPGGALTANTQMMRDNGILDRYPEVIKAMGEVVRRGGFGTSVTPVSQFYFQQAFNNVMFGPWKKIAKGYGKMVLGYFGRTPVPPDPDIVKQAAEQLKLEPTTRKVLAINDADPAKGEAACRALLKEAGINNPGDEAIFITASCGKKGIDFLLGKAVPNGVRKRVPTAAVPAAAAAGYTVSVNGRSYTVVINGDKAEVNGKPYDVSVVEGVSAATNGAEAVKPASTVGATLPVHAPMPGKVVRIPVKVGDPVDLNGVLLVLEAMKMELEVKSPSAGKVAAINVSAGDQVQAGQILISLTDVA